MAPCPFWTFWLPPMKMEVQVQQFPENQWDSHHTMSSKYSVIGTLHHRAETICSSNRKKNIYRKHSKNGNTLHGLWIRAKIKTKGSANKNRRDTTNSDQNNNYQKPCKVGLSESLKKVCSKHRVQVYFKGGNTIKNLLVAPKDQDPIQKMSGVIYRYKCDRVECDEEYIGESSRAFGERFKEHQKAPSPIYDHFNTTGHNITIDNFSIVRRKTRTSTEQ